MGWAVKFGQQVIPKEQVPAEYSSFAAELWSLLGAKTTGTARGLRQGLVEGHGLEFWRKLYAEFQPRSAVRAAKIQVQLLTLTPVAMSNLGRAIQKIDDKIMLHDSMATEPLHDTVRKTVYAKIAPPEVTPSCD